MLLRRPQAAEKRNAIEALSQGGNDVTEYETGGYLVWGTVADFADGEVRVVDMPAAEKTGVLHGQDSLVTLAERGARDALCSKLRSIRRKIHAKEAAW